MKTGVVYSDRFLDHAAPYYHPENPDRLRRAVQHLKARGIWERLEAIPFGPATLDDITLIHDPAYVRHVFEVCEKGGGILDLGDTYAGPLSAQVAALAVGGVIAATDAVIEGKVNHAICLVRPPGHHAERSRAMGFCLFNNIAIAARAAQHRHNISRVMIVDFDVHHGNGTQHAFYDDDSVFYLSLHQYPHYPGTGRKDETGVGRGEGTTLNFPFPPGTEEGEWLFVFEVEIPKIARSYRPEIIMVSAGFDAHRDDPLADQNLTDQGYEQIGRALSRIAREVCGGRLVTVLEGGYHPVAFPKALEAYLIGVEAAWS